MKSSDINPVVNPINLDQALTVRHPVLRSGRPIEDCYFEGDLLSTTFHFGIFLNQTLVGVATFLKQNIKTAMPTSQYQLRGMAILKQHQGQKIGQQLLSSAINELQKQRIDLIWCNARASAIDFYTKQGFTTTGSPFNVPNIGQHYKMIKKT